MDIPVGTCSRPYRQIFVTYVLVTACLVLPQIFAFVTNDSFFPFQRWALFSEIARPGSGYKYYILQGQEADGTWIDLPPSRLTEALTSRNYMLVRYVVNNRSFEISYPHPENIKFLERHPQLPEGARLPELLRAWGRIYNHRIATRTGGHLVRVRLLAFKWEGPQYANFRVPAGKWMVDL